MFELIYKRNAIDTFRSACFSVSLPAAQPQVYENFMGEDDSDDEVAYVHDGSDVFAEDMGPTFQATFSVAAPAAHEFVHVALCQDIGSSPYIEVGPNLVWKKICWKCF